MFLDIFMKPDNESIMKRELDMKSYDKVLIRNESVGSSYGYYYPNSNIIVFIPNEVCSEIIVYKNFESSNDLDAPSPPSPVQLGVIDAETEKRDIFPGEKLTYMQSHCGSDFEEIDISEALLPYLVPVEPDVETDNKNFKECGLSLDPSLDHTNAKQPEQVIDFPPSDSDEVDVTTVDNEFSTSFREECEKQVKRLGGEDCQALNGTVTHCSAKKEARSALPEQKNASWKGCPAQNGASRIVQQKWGKKEEMGKGISAETSNGAQSPIPRTSSGTSAGRLLCAVDSTFTSASSSICSGSELDPIDDRNWDMFMARKCWKQIDLMDDFQISKTRYSYNPGGVHQNSDENKGIFAETAKGVQFPISSTSSGTSKKRTLSKVDNTFTAASSSTYSSSELDPIDERDSHKLLDRKNRKQNGLMDDFRISKTRYSDNPGGVHQNSDENKGIFAETAKGVQFPISSTSSGTSKERTLSKVDNTFTAASSSTYSSSELDPIDERDRHKFLARKSRKQNGLMDDFRISKTRYSDNPGGVHRNRDENKGIFAETAKGVQFPISSTSSGTSKERTLCKVDNTFTAASSSTYSSSELDPIDERDRHKLLARKSRKQNGLMDDFRISKTRYSDNPGGVHRNRDENKGIFAETAKGVQFRISSTSSGTSKKRTLSKVDNTFTAASSSTYSSSELDPIDERDRHKLLARKSRKQNGLMDDFRISKTRYSDNPGCVYQNSDENKGIFAETAKGVQFPISSTSSGTSKERTLCKVDNTFTAASSSTYSSSELDPIDERDRHKLLARKSRKQNGLMDDFRISKTRNSDNTGGVHRNRDENKCIFVETANGVQFPISCTSNGTSKERTFSKVDNTFTAASSSTYSRCELDPIDERDRHKLLAMKSRKQNGLMDDFRISKTRYSYNPGGVHQNSDENKGIFAETAKGVQFPISSTSSGTSKERMLIKVDSTSTSASSSTYSSSEFDPIDERYRHKLLARKNRKKQKELMDDLRILVPRDNPRGIQLKSGYQEDMSKCISVETTSGAESPISSTSSEARAKRKRKIWQNPSIGKKYRKEQNELMEDLRLLTPGILDNAKIPKINILTFAREYIEQLKQNLEAKQKRIEDLRNKNNSLLQEFRNSMDGMDNIPLSWFC